MLERGEPGDVLARDLVALGAELVDGGVEVPGRPQHHAPVAQRNLRESSFPWVGDVFFYDFLFFGNRKTENARVSL
ncbi:hypothetical protein GCM10023195_07180 [Actinoallomurus liliacearum]|uniref:Uncharacterized protein n=1 Tax=Actinoallomurus liliacearum TaxID=1080073 RepID=A0ABP8TDN6_9ACTN